MVAATEHQLANKISELSIYGYNVFSENGNNNKKDLESIIKMFYYEGITLEEKELGYLATSLGNYIGLYEGIYDLKKDMDFKEFINNN